MSAKAFVLIEAAPAQAKKIAASLRKVSGIHSIDAVTGPYDIIAVVEQDTLAEMGEFITSKIQAVEGITRTVTCLAL
ncbi:MULTISPECIES: Lrp/AsnC ligand binding domain-containing protein [Dehalococcoides]|jgi:DNA-binding Lrp family transcriptional regulator|uniref:AsnC family transcriptional regulator n=2 Tax=Dehalococcoides mccartyi TaxID=61435 RepID=A0A142VAR4_9CHLR|nr:MULTISPECIES: Lrp/AsnC ligand binding domain-containing protein [Dehalococcoides]AGG06730.1 transcriptional regulator, AsnC family [Dehalococcoides mccartyi DCMB5]AGG08225.1 transcriptional regulator, AsnC family [Dehalococcoides mccartyi BTF08]AII61229.1 AsnC family transcriptional regulator [Dehalococcoides mccartyi CG5]AMU86924.1 AsnC family transcriptional regulator [Dehalococcoides mccartyi]AOV99714.1 transcriptional regulator [Dehalococcoides mccartyi]